MPLCCGKGTMVAIEIANGCNEEIFCKVTCDQEFVKRRAGEGGLDIGGIAGANARIEEDYEHIIGGQDGYTSIWSNGTMTFDMVGKPVYVTIVTKSKKKVCFNHQANKSRGFIVSEGFHLKDAATTLCCHNIWTDLSGKNHKRHESNVEEYLIANDQNYDVGPIEMVDLGIGNIRHESSDTVEVTIANGCEEIIYCRIKGLQNESTPTGYTPVAPLSYLRFTPSGRPVYMTIISKSNTLICVNHEINNSRGFIISHGKFLKDAARGNIWIDTSGKDHEIEDAHNTVSNIENFDAGNLFEKKTLTSAL